MTRSGKSINNLFVYLSLVFFACQTYIYAQLPEFSLQLQKQDESCVNNGSITFSTSGTNPLASILYTVYKYPDLTLPVSVLETSVLGGLGAGQYKVKASQILNLLSNVQEKDITINHVSIPFAYTITASGQNCVQGAQVIITATSGTATLFEIISGPVTRPVQVSNVFNGLPPGTYNIKAYDDCGEGLVTTYTLSANNGASISISDPVITQTDIPDCSRIVIGNSISSTGNSHISYPLAVRYTIHPPDGSPDIVINDLINSGDPDSLEIQHIIATYGQSEFSYDVTVTDNCGAAYIKNNQVVDPAPVIKYSTPPNTCGQKYLELNVSNYVAPYQITFSNPPAGFDPSQFNTTHPGPFTNSHIVYGGEQNVVPEGDYMIMVTDACGRTGEVLAEIDYDIKEATGTGRNNGCFSLLGRINVSVPDTDIVAARILSAPPDYATPLPQNVTSSISNGRLMLNNMILGNYMIEVTDECNITHEVTVVVPAFVQRPFGFESKPDCASGTSAVRFWSRNSALTEATIIAAPADFSHALPYDGTSAIASSGEFYIDNLPLGSYSFRGKDACGVEETLTFSVLALQEDTNAFTFLPNCGSFDIDMNDATPLSDAKYWLQKQDEATGVWGHPTTGAIYTDGDLPTATDSKELDNGQVTHNLTLTGHFRIIRSFESFTNAADTKLCLKILGDFSYSMDLTIADAFNLACTGSPDDILIVAEGGLEPYTYTITHKNDQPFTLNNGNNATFSGLEPATYTFMVYDGCTNNQPITLNIASLPPLVTAGIPTDMVNCGSTSVTNQPFNVRAKDAEILAGQSPALYMVTYHLSRSDADNATNAQPDTIYNSVNNQVIYARIIHKSILICHKVVTFRLKVSPSPVLAMPLQYYICGAGGTVSIEADGGMDSYEWSDGQTTRIATFTTPGTYTLTVYRDGCPAVAAITVAPSQEPEIEEIKITDWSVSDNSITVVAKGVGNYVYSINDGPFQGSNVFEGLATGVYNVTVKDEFGCGEVSGEVTLLNYPKFFTPNGDGENERWRIEFAVKEPDLQVYIYDRYGKLITGFTGESEGWDGTLNGRHLPSTDYWFVVERESGIVYKGHFSLIR